MPGVGTHGNGRVSCFPRVIFGMHALGGTKNGAAGQVQVDGLKPHPPHQFHRLIGTTLRRQLMPLCIQLANLSPRLHEVSPSRFKSGARRKLPRIRGRQRAGLGRAKRRMELITAFDATGDGSPWRPALA